MFYTAKYSRHGPVFMSKVCQSSMDPTNLFKQYILRRKSCRYMQYKSMCTYSGKFKHIRQALDSEYHADYSIDRQQLQDCLVDSLIHTDQVTFEDEMSCIDYKQFMYPTANSDSSKLEDQVSYQKDDTTRQQSKDSQTFPVSDRSNFQNNTQDKMSASDTTGETQASNSNSLTTSNPTIQSIQSNNDPFHTSHVSSDTSSTSQSHAALSTAQRPWIVFSAGPMGAGKSHTLRWLSQRGLFPLYRFVYLDPDIIKRGLPEVCESIRTGQELTHDQATMAHRESGYVCEIAERAALEQNRWVLIDGSLRDAEWYSGVFSRIRAEYPQYRIGILHIFASKNRIMSRIQKRGESTGRIIPSSLVELAYEQVPKSVARLSPLADYVVHIDNDGPRPYILQPSDEISFQSIWTSKELPTLEEFDFSKCLLEKPSI